MKDQIQNQRITVVIIHRIYRECETFSVNNVLEGLLW